MKTPLTADRLLDLQKEFNVTVILWNDPEEHALIGVGADNAGDFALIKVFDPVKRVHEPERISMGVIQEVRFSE